MNTEPQIEPVTDDDLYEFEMARRNAKVFTRDKMVMRKHALEQDRRRVAERQAGRAEAALSPVLDAYEKQTRALPNQHEIPERWCCSYNWRMAIIRDLRAMLSMPPKEKGNG